MDGHTHTRKQRTIAVPLVFVVVLCFLCALCHSAAQQGAPLPLAETDCPEQSEVLLPPPSDASNLTHACQAADGHGLPTAQPLFLFALGAVLIFALRAAPPPGRGPRPHRPDPVVPHGSGLLTLLCVQRV